MDWIGKAIRARAEPRILIEDGKKSHCASFRSRNDIFQNELIHGDNLLALKALPVISSVSSDAEIRRRTGFAFEFENGTLTGDGDEASSLERSVRSSLVFGA